MWLLKIKMLDDRFSTVVRSCLVCVRRRSLSLTPRGNAQGVVEMKLCGRKLGVLSHRSIGEGAFLLVQPSSPK